MTDYMWPCWSRHKFGPWTVPQLYPTWEPAEFMQRICVQCLYTERQAVEVTDITDAREAE